MIIETVRKMCYRLAELGLKESIQFVTQEEFDKYNESMKIENIRSQHFEFKIPFKEDGAVKDSLGCVQYDGVAIYFLLMP